MDKLLNEVKKVYQKEGLAILALKIGRTGIEPLLGTERAQLWQYAIARRLTSRKLPILNIQLPEKRITIKNNVGNIFFGFYDHTPFCHRNERVLFNKTTTSITPVLPEDKLKLCYYDLNTGETNTFAETRTWNWQQGCRLHWHPTMEDIAVYNCLIDNGYGSVFRNVGSGEIIEKYQTPIYDTDPKGRFAVSVNFSRLERLHDDYGYANLSDDTTAEPHPTDDGIYRLDLETNETKLLVSYNDLANITGISDNIHNYVMNLMISPSGKYISFLHRYHEKNQRKTHLFIIEMDGSGLNLLQEAGEASHPTWRSKTELFTTVNFFKDGRETKYFTYDLKDGRKYEICHPKLNVDSHPNFSPAHSNIFVGDTYPDYRGDRHLYVFDIKSNEYNQIGSVYGPVLNGIKRDLHPRWDRRGEYICIDMPNNTNTQTISIIRYD